MIICITGMPGAGKTTVAEVLRSAGYSVITMGDVVREEAGRQGLELDDVTLGKLMLRLRKEHGPAALALLIAEKIKKSKNNLLVIDGLRSLQEVEVLKQHGTVRVLAIHAPRQARFRFLTDRKRSDAPDSLDEFDSRDRREFDVGIGEAVSFSDSVITNDGTIKELQKRALEVVGRWKK